MVIEELDRYRIILASRSPRRQQLLRQAGIRFDVVIREYDEIYPADLSGEAIAAYIAQGKAASFKNEIKDNEIVITADTLVWCNGKILGKPVVYDEVILMLGEISGKTHEVITGVTLLSREREVTFSESTKVTFEKMTDEEIKFYADKFKPYDKAGAYGIQEWIGLIACSRIEGSYFNVVGLPVHRLYSELKKFVTLHS